MFRVFFFENKLKLSQIQVSFFQDMSRRILASVVVPSCSFLIYNRNRPRILNAKSQFNFEKYQTHPTRIKVKILIKIFRHCVIIFETVIYDADVKIIVSVSAPICDNQFSCKEPYCAGPYRHKA